MHEHGGQVQATRLRELRAILVRGGTSLTKVGVSVNADASHLRRIVLQQRRGSQRLIAALRAVLSEEAIMYFVPSEADLCEVASERDQSDQENSSLKALGIESVRRHAARSGMRVEKSRERNPGSPKYQRFALIEIRTNAVVLGGGPTGLHSCTLAEIASYLDARVEVCVP